MSEANPAKIDNIISPEGSAFMPSSSGDSSYTIRSPRIKLMVGGLLLAASSLLCCAIVLGFFRNETVQEEQDPVPIGAQLNEKVGLCLQSSEAAYCEKLKQALQDQLTVEEEDRRIQAAILLSSLYKQESSEDAIQVLRSCLSETISDENRYYLLSTIHSIASEEENIPELIDSLRELVQLPNELYLATEDWNLTKKLFTAELEELEVKYEEKND